MNLSLSFYLLSTMKDIGEVDVRTAPHESLRHDSDYSSHLSVEFQLAAEHSGVSAKLLLPELVAKNGHRLRALDSVRYCSAPADQRQYAHHVERIHRAMITAQALRVAVACPDHV